MTLTGTHVAGEIPVYCQMGVQRQPVIPSTEGAGRVARNLMEQLRPSNNQLCKYETTGERKRFLGERKKCAGKRKDHIKTSLKSGYLGVIIHSQPAIQSQNSCINEVTYDRMVYRYLCCSSC